MTFTAVGNHSEVNATQRADFGYREFVTTDAPFTGASVVDWHEFISALPAFGAIGDIHSGFNDFLDGVIGQFQILPEP